MALLGDDGLGYELAKKLESCGVWRSWLGDSLYAAFVHSLTSPSAWDSFMRVDDSKSRAQIHLQLRARALLFDKAAVSLFLQPAPSSSSSVVISKLNPNYLQLHGDDVYFTLENSSQDGASQRESSIASNSTASKSKGNSSVPSRYGDSGIDSVSQKLKHDDLPETWYSQFFERYGAVRPFRLSLWERESEKRTAEEMYSYLCVSENNKRKRAALKEDLIGGYGNSTVENTPHLISNSSLDANRMDDGDSLLIPEAMFAWNSVPDNALPPIIREDDGQKVDFHGIFDMLPHLSTRSPVMIERLGIRPECLSMDQGGSLRGRNETHRNRKPLSKEQACQLSQKAVAKVLTNVGFEGATEVPVEVFSQLLGCHMRKLGRILKTLADSYRKQCSPIELLKMFLQAAGYSNLTALAEHVKAGSRNVVQQAQQQAHVIQSQMQPQQIRLPQQMPRQMHPQMQQIIHQQNLAFQQQQQQQQLERMRRLHPSTPRPGMDMDKDSRPLVQVKLENQELPMDSSAFNSMNSRNPQMQFRQQQLAAMSNLQAQPGNQFRQMASLQIPQLQTQNINIVKAPPVKVEGFSELMGGVSSLKHDGEDKLTSPSSK